MTTNKLAALLPVALLLGTAACAGDEIETGRDQLNIDNSCVVRADLDRYDRDSALTFFKWNGTKHSTMSRGRLSDKLDSLRAKFANETDIAKRAKLSARVMAGTYMLNYSAAFQNSAGALVRKRAKSYSPSVETVCHDSGCEAGAVESDTFIHSAYRTFLGRDATSSEVASSLTLLPDASDASFDSTAAYHDELANFVDSSFINTAALCATDADGRLMPGVATSSVFAGPYQLDLGNIRRSIRDFAIGSDYAGATPPTMGLPGDPYVVSSAAECLAAMQDAHNKSFGSSQYANPGPDDYRYNLNPSATPDSCPKPRVPAL